MKVMLKKKKMAYTYKTASSPRVPQRERAFATVLSVFVYASFALAVSGFAWLVSVLLFV